ncbi:dihydrofolate reductase-like isoform X2 [Tigriopus californicus]|uniref:dihydrofolate reductase-like isoform X2 n=1 Tax=Tigriopus californicus TaxID=6832 RepID=UPI0027DAA3BE|nr:dihydrofolate reductase-like isoform X2 [Tigriopus californicus]
MRYHGTKACWIMGRNTFEQQFSHNQPFSILAGKESPPVVKIVLSTSWSTIPSRFDNVSDVKLARNWTQVIDLVNSLCGQIEEAWNIGGPLVYTEQIKDIMENRKRYENSRLYVTKISASFPCDLFFPRIDFKSMCELPHENGNEIMEESEIQFTYHVFELQHVKLTSEETSTSSRFLHDLN